jgi:hypothetical protein
MLLESVLFNVKEGVILATVTFDDKSKGILVTAKEMIKGDPGEPGKDGKDGYTPIKGVDYFDGKDGEPGPAGKDGYTPIKGVDYFDGEPGPAGPAGKDGTVVFEELTDEQKALLKGDQGEPGPAGPKGDSYVLTEEDKSEIALLAVSVMPHAEGVKF